MSMRVRYTTIEGEIIAENRSGERKQYIPDAQGNVMALIDDNQSVTDTITFWPYGEVVERTGTTPTPFLYSGSFGGYGDNSSTYYMRARYYDAETDRWLTQDPVGINYWLNLYTYCFESPLTFVDPNGQYPSKPTVSWPIPIRLPIPPVYPKAPYKTNWPTKFYLPGDYGHHCGLYVYTDPPGRRIGDEDCIDTGCQHHDECVDNHVDKCLHNPGYKKACDNALCAAAKACVSKCTTKPCKVEAVLVAAYFCNPVGPGSYLKTNGSKVWPPTWAP